jgi:hypothetical protein
MRDDRVFWQREFLSVEDDMCRSLDNLEHNHFRRTGDAERMQAEKGRCL